MRQQHTASLDRIHAVAARYLAVLGSEPIAIEMSGGLDTAIVIDVLRSLGANLVLVGFMSERYEFRTERAIQEQYLRDADPVIALSDDDGPPFADLTQTPLHPIPVAASLFHKMHSAVATAAASKGARRVLNGVGGDALLCDGFDGAIAGVIPDDHRGWGIFDPWPNDSVYMPRGMSYVPSFALWPIPELVWSMRRGQGEDVRKVWARRLFDGRLSRELTKYAYKADHNAWFHDGLRRAESDIRRIARTAYELTKRTELHPETMSRDVLRSTTLDDVAQCALLSRLCFASWVHGFAREGLM